MISWIINAALLGLAAYIIPGIHIHTVWAALGAVLVLGALNLLVRPILVLLTLPVTIITLGLFMLVINTLMFYMAGNIFDGFKVDTWLAAFLGSLFYSFLGAILTSRRD